MAYNFGYTASEEDFLFISYVGDDGRLVIEYVQPMAEHLKLWSDQEIPPGADWELELYEHVRKAQAVVFFITDGFFRNAFNDEEPSFMLREYKWAKKLGKKMIPVLIHRYNVNTDCLLRMRPDYSEMYQEITSAQGVFCSSFSAGSGKQALIDGLVEDLMCEFPDCRIPLQEAAVPEAAPPAAGNMDLKRFDSFTLGCIGGYVLEWTVIEVRENSIQLLLRRCIDREMRDSLSRGGETSPSLPEWLNGAFLEKCFSPEEQKLLMPFPCGDYVRLPDAETAAASIVGTVFATAYPIDDPYCANACWWLMPPDGALSTRAPIITSDGVIDCYGLLLSNPHCCVRPCVLLRRQPAA